MKITYITGNQGKLAELQRFITAEIDHVALDLPEIQSLSPREIVEQKVRQAYQVIREPVLVEDVSFSLLSLGGLPGPFIKWFERALGEEGICRLVDGKKRDCIASVLFGYYDGDAGVVFAEGEMKGSIAESPRGENSFGWGSIFIPEGMDRTYAELTHDEQAEIAMRKKALLNLVSLLPKAE